MIDPREAIQLHAKQAWLNSNRKNTIIVGTGGGKSKICIDLIKEINPSSILLLTNSESLRDTNWKDEFIKWNYPWDKVVSECYQTTHRWLDKEFDLVVGDEIDYATTTVYSKVFFNNKFNNILGLTGFCTEEKRELLEKIAPVCFEISGEQLQEQGALNKTEFILIEYPLSLEKTIEQKNNKTNKKFLVSENDQYKYWDKAFQQAMIIKSQIEKRYRLQGINFELEKDWQSADWKFKIAATKRKKILHSSPATTQVTKNLLDYIHSKPGNKVLVFNTLTSEADKLPNPFHGKTEEDVSGIERLNKGDINTLSVVKKITRGVNLVNVNYLIRATFDGSETDLSQSLGRLMRLKVDQVAKYLILLPMFIDSVRTPNGSFKTELFPTQAFKWKDKMMASLSNPVIKTVRLDKTLKIKNG